jgi:hypothetical protein
MLGAQCDIVLLALAVRTAGVSPALLNFQFLQYGHGMSKIPHLCAGPCPNAPTAPSHHTARLTQGIFSFPRFADAKPHSTCGTGRNACATEIASTPNVATAPSSIAGHGMPKIPH